MLNVTKVTLESPRVSLIPLELEHVEPLANVARDGELWTIKVTTVPATADTLAYVERALKLRDSGSALPFVIRLRDTAQIVGTTRYMNIDAANHRVEIGSTWIARSWQRTFVNTQCKYLLLQHAFEALGCNAVEFRTDVLNTQSRNAILRLGAKEEGVLRAHMIMRDGRVRDTICYSILKQEWPDVKGRLQGFMQGAAP